MPSASIPRGSGEDLGRHSSAEEAAAHEARLAAIDKASGGNCVWKKLEAAEKA